MSHGPWLFALDDGGSQPFRCFVNADYCCPKPIRAGIATLDTCSWLRSTRRPSTGANSANSNTSSYVELYVSNKPLSLPGLCGTCRSQPLPPPIRPRDTRHPVADLGAEGLHKEGRKVLIHATVPHCAVSTQTERRDATGRASKSLRHRRSSKG
jgi:hypothetical protein